MEVLSAELVQRLARWKGSGISSQESGVVTLYLNVDGRENIRPEDYLLQLEAMVREALAKDSRKSVAVDLERITQFVTEEFERGSNRGLAIFACGEQLWEVVALPLPVENRLVVNLAPHVRQLETLLDEHEATGVLLTDKQRARLLVIELGRVVEREEIIDPLPRHDDDKGDWEKDHVKNHSSVIAQQHLKHAAQAMFDLYQRHHFDHLVLCIAEELSSELKRNLHDYLSQKVVGCVSLPVNASDDDVMATAFELTRAYERERERKFVERLREANGAVAGLDPTLEAIFERRVDTLLVSEGYIAEGWRCTECTYIATIGRKCRMCGATMTLVEDVVEEAVGDALGQKCRVEFCSDNADLDVMGRIGALLRF